jgi:hypothetical protein
MATTTISDYVIWAKHIHDDPLLSARVAAMQAGETIDLDVDGVPGAWRRMDNGKDGRPTLGLRPLGSAQDAWRELYTHRKGQIARVAAVEANPGVSEQATASFRFDLARFVRTDAERQAALAALLDGGRQGARSEHGGLARDEMHDR